RSDGTSTGTILVRDIFSGTASSHPNSLTVLGNSIAFAVAGSGLWASDWTSSGTNRLRSVSVDNASTGPVIFPAFHSALYFRASDARHGSEIWKADPAANLLSVTTSASNGTYGTGQSIPLTLNF